MSEVLLERLFLSSVTASKLLLPAREAVPKKQSPEKVKER